MFCGLLPKRNGEPLGIITLGPEGTFSHQAALKLFPKKKIAFASSIDEIFFRLADPQFSEGVIPMENTVSEFVEETILNLMKYDFSLTRKVVLPISFHLVGEGEEITHLYAHPHALVQCRASIREKLPHVKIIETQSNALSAIQYLANPKKSAALISTFSKQYYDLPTLAENVEDHQENMTTFFAVGKEPCKKGKGKHGTAFLLFSEESVMVSKEIATLCHEKKIPLIKLKNLVLQEGHTPLYFIEIEGHIEERDIHQLFETLSEKFLIKHLGSYNL